MANGQLGDIQPKFADPLETYYDILRQGVALPRKKFIVSPEFEPCRVDVPPGPGADVAQKVIDAQQKMFECHVIPRVWQLLVDFWQRSQCGTYFVKNPNWIEPPVTASCIDERGGPVTVDRGVGPVEIVRVVVPDRYVASAKEIANGLADPVGFPDVQWSVKVNDRPVECYDRVVGGIGTLDDPEAFTNPVRLKHQDVLTVTAEIPAASALLSAEAFARIAGFWFPAKEISQSGSWSQYHTI